PHNSILWIWMRLGTIGYVFLWFLIGTAIVQAAQLVRRLQDRFLQGMILFVLVMLLQQVIISYVDLQWSNYRTMIVTGMLFALISRLAAIAQAEKRLRAGSQPMPGIHARARSGLQAADRGVMAGYSRAVASLSAGRERERSLALPRLSVIQGETGVPSAERECTGPTAGAVSALRASGGAVDHLAGLDTMPDAAGISLFAAAGVPLYQVQAGAAEAETTVQESFAETGLLGRLDAWKGSELAEWSFVPRERLLPEAEVLDLIPEDNL
ncbi:MAG: hypothetical protein JOZ41_10210, partial [Chloroflexi bacterium]|nr:hypothetical protein [Chloroflexota bacterium]